MVVLWIIRTRNIHCFKAPCSLWVCGNVNISRLCLYRQRLVRAEAFCNLIGSCPSFLSYGSPKTSQLVHSVNFDACAGTDGTIWPFEILSLLQRESGTILMVLQHIFDQLLLRLSA